MAPHTTRRLVECAALNVLGNAASSLRNDHVCKRHRHRRHRRRRRRSDERARASAGVLISGERARASGRRRKLSSGGRNERERAVAAAAAMAAGERLKVRAKSAKNGDKRSARVLCSAFLFCRVIAAAAADVADDEEEAAASVKTTARFRVSMSARSSECKRNARTFVFSSKTHLKRRLVDRSCKRGCRSAVAASLVHKPLTCRCSAYARRSSSASAQRGRSCSARSAAPCPPARTSGRFDRIECNRGRRLQKQTTIGGGGGRRRQQLGASFACVAPIFVGRALVCKNFSAQKCARPLENKLAHTSRVLEMRTRDGGGGSDGGGGDTRDNF